MTPARWYSPSASVSVHKVISGSLTDTTLEEVGLAFNGDVLHEVKGVFDIVDAWAAESDEETVADELDVSSHGVAVNAEQCHRQCSGKELKSG